MSLDIAPLLRTYPRTRPALSAAHQRVYEAEYKLNRQGSAAVEGLAKKLEGWMHARVAARAGEDGRPVLELGAGTLNHVPWELGKTEAPYDAVEPFAALYADSPHRGRIRTLYGSIHDVPVDNRYGRVISVAVLEHMTDLPRDIARAALLLDDGGVFQAGIPSEGGFLWGLAWRLSTGLTYRLRTGLDYKSVMRHEHVNTAAEILAVIRYLFADVTVRRFPLPLHHMSFYAYIEASTPDVARCRAVLAD